MDRPRIFRVGVTLPDGKRRARLVKAPYYERSPADSLFGLAARLVELEMDGVIVSHTITAPRVVGPRQREQLQRWPVVLPELLKESA